MELYIWEGEPKWGLPSMDLKSLQIWTYIKFSGADVKIIRTKNPFQSPSGELPAFSCSDGILSSFTDVASFLRKKNFGCDYELSAKQCSEVKAYEALLHEKLYPALVYLWWVEPKNYYDVINKWYYRNIPFPFKLWYPNKIQKLNNEFIFHVYDDLDRQILETELHKQARECLTALSWRLGEKDNFFGHGPSTLDALVFSYLALLVKVDLHVPDLQNHIKACTNLSKFVTKTLQRYFPQDIKSSCPQSPVHEDVPNKGFNLFLSGLVAIGAMCGYAVHAGLVQVDMNYNANEILDEEEDCDYGYEEFEDKSGND